MPSEPVLGRQCTVMYLVLMLIMHTMVMMVAPAREVSGGVGASIQTPISGVGAIMVPQHPVQGQERCRMLGTRRTCRIVCSDGSVRRCQGG